MHAEQRQFPEDVYHDINAMYSFFLKDFKCTLDIYITTDFGVKTQDLLLECTVHKPEAIKHSVIKVPERHCDTWRVQVEWTLESTALNLGSNTFNIWTTQAPKSY